jgi:hypothetical protein
MDKSTNPIMVYWLTTGRWRGRLISAVGGIVFSLSYGQTLISAGSSGSKIKEIGQPLPITTPTMFSVVARTAFNASRNGVVRAGVVPSSSLAAVQTAEKHTLILVRHGESTWNLENKFTGWVDVPLSPKGHEEVIEAGKLMNEAGLLPEVAFTSLQKRAIRTLWHVLEETDRMWIPTTKAWQLNERHYGALQGLDKQETVDKYGKDQVLIWRRSYDIPPPVVDRSSPHHPGNDPR